MFGALLGAVLPFAGNIFGGIGKFFERRQELKRLDKMNAHQADLAKQRGETDFKISESDRLRQTSSDSATLLGKAYKHDTAQANGMVEMMEAAAGHCGNWTMNLIAVIFASVMALRAAIRPLWASGAFVVWAHAEWLEKPLSDAGQELVTTVVVFYFTDRAKSAYKEYRSSGSPREATRTFVTGRPSAPKAAASPNGGLSEQESAP